MDLVLPFGLRSAANIFNTVADALAWHLIRASVEFIDHYLNDFIILGAPDTSQCQWNGVSFLTHPPASPS